jgi:hypothetical protein
MNACKLTWLRAHRVELRLVNVCAARTSKRRNGDRCRSSLDERLGGGASSGASGKNVVDKQNVPAANCCGIGDLEGATNIVPALARPEASLTPGGAKPQSVLGASDRGH